MQKMKSILIIILTCILTACGEHSVSSFMVQNATLNHQDFNQLTDREPVESDEIGSAVAMHRIKMGDNWILGYREHEQGGWFSGTDSSTSTKITVLFPGNKKPEGVYQLNKISPLIVYFSSFIPFMSALRACYVQVSQGSIHVQWLDETHYRAVIDIQVDKPDPPLKNINCTLQRYKFEVKGQITALNQLGQWGGVPKSYSFLRDDTFNELLPYPTK